MTIPVTIRRPDGTERTLIVHTHQERDRTYLRMLKDMRRAAEKHPHKAVQVYAATLKQLEGR